MAIRLPTSICCVTPVDRAHVYVFDPDEAAPTGVRPDPLVRLYDPFASPLLPWPVLELKRLQLVPADSEEARDALALYARREERSQAALEASRERQKVSHRAAENERRREQAAERERLERAVREKQAEAAAARAWEEAERKRAEEAARARLVDQARQAHLHAASADDALEVFELRPDDEARVRVAALWDPGAGAAGEGRVVFVPTQPDSPFEVVEGRRWQERTPLRGKRARQVVAKYRAWQAEERAVEERKARADAFHAALERARALAMRPLDDAIALDRLPLDGNDLRLALMWCQEDAPELFRDVSRRLAKHGGDFAAFCHELQGVPALQRPDSAYLLTRMLSARLAEVAVRELYQARDPALSAGARPLVDMSIRQATGETPFDRSYDLGYPEPRHSGAAPPSPACKLDVKNARIRTRDPRYTHHYVKRARRLPDGTAVTLVGAVSEVDKLIHLLRRWPGDGRVRVLGETDCTRIDRLEAEYGLGTLKLNLTRVGKAGRFFPPWMFDAPEFLAAGRNAAFARLRSAHLACRHDPGDRGEVPVPLAIAAGIPLGHAQAERLSPGQRALAAALLARDEERRRSLPHLYLTLLREFFALLAAPGGARGEYDPARYHEVLFLHGDETSPVGISDPLKSVASLLASLGHLLDYGWEKLRRFDAFEFQQAGVLYAWKEGAPEARWTLMFTHCGNVSECGRKHLVVGREALCTQCRHLACTACGYCHRDCAHNRLTLREREMATR